MSQTLVFEVSNVDSHHCLKIKDHSAGIETLGKSWHGTQQLRSFKRRKYHYNDFKELFSPFLGLAGISKVKAATTTLLAGRLCHSAFCGKKAIVAAVSTSHPGAIGLHASWTAAHCHQMDSFIPGARILQRPGSDAL